MISLEYYRIIGASWRQLQENGTGPRYLRSKVLSQSKLAREGILLGECRQARAQEAAVKCWLHINTELRPSLTLHYCCILSEPTLQHTVRVCMYQTHSMEEGCSDVVQVS